MIVAVVVLVVLLSRKVVKARCDAMSAKVLKALRRLCNYRSCLVEAFLCDYSKVLADILRHASFYIFGTHPWSVFGAFSDIDKHVHCGHLIGNIADAPLVN